MQFMINDRVFLRKDLDDEQRNRMYSFTEDMQADAENDIKFFVHEVMKDGSFRIRDTGELEHHWCVWPEWIRHADVLEKPAKGKPAAKKKKAPVKPKKTLGATIKGAAGSGTSCASFGYRWKDDKGDVRDFIYKNAPCHAAFKRQYHYGGTAPFVKTCADNGVILEAVEWMAGQQQKLERGNGKEASKAYLEWLWNESPWKDCFLTKKYGTALRYGLKYNVNMPHACLLSAAVATRMASEWVDHRDGWYEEYKRTGDGCLALLLGVYFNPQKRVPRVLTGGHHFLTGGHSCKELLTFLVNDGKVWGGAVNKGSRWSTVDNWAICDAVANQYTAEPNSIRTVFHNVFKAVGGQRGEYGGCTTLNRRQHEAFRGTVSMLYEVAKTLLKKGEKA